jgi:hypothetical protein
VPDDWGKRRLLQYCVDVLVSILVAGHQAGDHIGGSCEMREYAEMMTSFIRERFIHPIPTSLRGGVRQLVLVPALIKPYAGSQLHSTVGTAE